MSSNSEELNAAALAYHRFPKPGKLEIQATKPLANQRDLALAYSPGVAAACTEIANNPAEAATLTSRANLVAVVSNGTAVLGLGNIGPLASKPVMEGKAVLFKKFAGIDVFDIEIAADTIERVVETVAALEPTFGGINLEDIKGPECFEIEAQLKERMKIPVFHDDQHGTAIIVGAAVVNALMLNGKKLPDVKIVCSGAGAAALATLNLLVSMGAQRKNIFVCDIDGVVHEGRNTLMDRWKAVYAQKTSARVLGDVIGGADIFLGLSAPNVLKPEMVKAMGDKPLVLALANPVPEIMPDEARAARPDAMICTGRSDFPNQVNNVLCFPFIFRGALDVGATAINEEMKHAAVEAIAQLARDPPSDAVAHGFDASETQGFGPGSLIPSPFDPRLILRIAPAVAKAAMDSGVATRPIKNFDEYRAHAGALRVPLRPRHEADVCQGAHAAGARDLCRRRGRAGAARDAGRAGGEGGAADPGRPALGRRSAHQALWPRDQGRARFRPRQSRGRSALSLLCAVLYRAGRPSRRDAGGGAHRGAHQQHGDRGARGVARRSRCDAVRRRGPLHASSAPCARDHRLPAWRQRLCGAVADDHQQGRAFHRRHPGEAESDAPRNWPKWRRSPPCMCSASPSSPRSRSCHIPISAATIRTPRARCAVPPQLLREKHPEIEADGEMQGDTALSEAARKLVLPHSKLEGEANILIMPNLDTANVAYQMIKTLADALPVGPILIGPARPAHILTPSVTARGILNMTAVAAVEAQERAGRQQPSLFG